MLISTCISVSRTNGLIRNDNTIALDDGQLIIFRRGAAKKVVVQWRIDGSMLMISKGDVS